MAKNKANKTQPTKSKNRFSFGDEQIGADIIRAFYNAPEGPSDYSNPYDLNRGMPIVAELMNVYPDMPLHVATGVVANSGVESYFNPAVSQGQNPDATGKVRGGGRGLFQWDGARRQKLMEMYPGDEWKKLENQLAFMAMENAGGEKRAWEATLKAPTAEKAALTFSQRWERPGVPHNELRKNIASRLDREATSVGEELFKKYFAPIEQMPGEFAASWSGQPMVRTMQMATPEERNAVVNEMIAAEIKARRLQPTQMSRNKFAMARLPNMAYNDN